MGERYQQPIKQYQDGLFNSLSGELININKPTAEMIKLEDIANALSKICRFGGHIPQFYSVAQHSVIVAALAPEDRKFEALMHDAAEAYVGDMIKPLKNIIGIPFYTLEDLFIRVICEKFSLDYDKMQKLKEYDVMALEVEHEFLINKNKECWTFNMNTLKLPDTIMNHHEAKYEFMIAFHKYAPVEVYNRIMREEAHIGTL